MLTVNNFILYILRMYKRAISPMLPPACRFSPSCSEYAIEAFETKGLFKALWMTVVRLSKCHPFHPGGYDPVQ